MDHWLKQSQESLALIYAHAGIGICRVSPEGRFLQPNPMFCKITGYSETELRGMHFLDLTHPDDRPTSSKWKDDFATGTRDFVSSEKRYIHKQGHHIWIRITVTSVRDESGKLEHFVTSIEDITERKLSEDLLRLQNEVLEFMARNMPLNDTLNRIIQLIEEQAPGATGAIFLVDDGKLHLGAAPGFPESFVSTIDGAPIGPKSGPCGAAAFSGRRAVSTDVSKDEFWGELRDFALSYGIRAAWSTPVLSRDGKVIGTVSMCWKEPKVPTNRHFALADVATKLMGIAIERDRTQRLVREQQMKMIASSKLAALGEMAGGLAHEINNPLAIISGRSAQLALALKHGQATQMLLSEISESIEKTTTRISRIIKGLKAFARDGEHDPEQEFALDHLIEDTLSFCRERFKSHAIALEVNCPPNLKMRGRAVQLSQVLLNLLNNSHDAVESLPEKWARVDVVKDENGLTISVTDSGHGIPEHLRFKILEPFYTTKDPNRGTGLELIREARKTGKPFRAILLTGFTDFSHADIQELGIEDVLYKPFDLSVLVARAAAPFRRGTC